LDFYLLIKLYGYNLRKLKLIIFKTYRIKTDLTKRNVRKSKQSQKKKDQDKKTEKQICLEKGLVRIWDCGKKKWSYKI
jgi:hypothetical protein